MVDTDNCLINVALALAPEVEGSGLGGFERVARPVCLYIFRNRLDLGQDRWCGIDTDCAQREWFTGVSGGITQLRDRGGIHSDTSRWTSSVSSPKIQQFLLHLTSV